ncbi:alpha/beta fold hydrolase [Zhouia amylolytica]|uniref:Dipeptidyl peptidase IV domain containing protein n=1 Tax=Zhouia amylolytica AD3 TaxID=1286632 RepID=W2UJH9_9FLAO|nr:alpha/beta fold hydrolase [Zhouia amylolytica]ETN94124.1 dipeptidyl peptidase IV domain containing protein [Zhouia amylolytica AD3]
MKHSSLFLFLCVIVLFNAQSQNQSQLTIDQVMKGEDFVGYLPTRIEWKDDSERIYFSWNPDNDTIRSTYGVDLGSKKIEKLTFDELKLKSNSGHYSSDFKWKVYEKGGDLFLKNLDNYTVKRITNTLSWESNPQFSGDQKFIVFYKDNNIFAWSIKNGTTRQLTDFKKGNDKKEPELSEQDQWLENDQLAHFDILKKRKNESDAGEYRRDQTKFDRPESIYFGSRRLRIGGISPDLNYVVYHLYTSPNDKKTIVPNFVTQNGYTTDLHSRSKVGSPQANSETWIYNLKSGKYYQIKTDEIEGIFDKPFYLKEYAEDAQNYKEVFDAPRKVSISSPVFSDDGKAVVNITSADYKDRWIMLLDLSDGKLKLIDRQHDDAWIGGPGVGWFSRPEIGWIDNSNIWFQSEKTGYSHLYKANVNTGEIIALTKGEFEILDVSISRNKKTFYITSNRVSPHEHHFYHLPVKGGEMVKITSRKGGHEVTLSPDEKQLAIRYSYTNKPWELYLMPNKPGAKMVQLTKSTTEDFEAYDWMDSEIIHFTARDGVKVPATLYKPAAHKKNGAAVIFVHGAGYTQNVHYWWPSYYREYMFHNFLADNGYTVLAIDYRASEGYGRDWRTAIYRHMGGKDLEDQLDGAKYLIEKQNIDKDRLGIYGGSYGGFMTLMAMFKAPDTFKSGAALRSVTDWAHYNHGYTANILNTPVEDPVAYKRSSPIYFADGLKGELLMLHGMVDRNVQFQDVVRLSQRLIELKKENWDLAVFPMEDHGFIEASSWSDEYRRIYNLFENTLNR